MTQLQKGKILAEGKTKRIWEVVGNPKLVLIESKDDITAGDGARHDILLCKGEDATATTRNCFELLKRHNVLTHFIRQVDERTFLAHRMIMLPHEFVIRRIATGSYLKRYPDIADQTRFDSLVLEMFLKDDARHDPLMILDFLGRRSLLFEQGRPLKDGFIEECEMSYDLKGTGTIDHYIEEISRVMCKVFYILEDKWEEQNVDLVDLKIEFGFSTSRGLVIADVVDNDSWRIWPDGDRSQDKSKQIYRDSPVFTKEVERKLTENYRWVAERTGRFV